MLLLSSRLLLLLLHGACCSQLAAAAAAAAAASSHLSVCVLWCHADLVALAHRQASHCSVKALDHLRGKHNIMIAQVSF
jgi:hypothetical protein